MARKVELDKEKVKELYLRGYKAFQIAIMLNCNASTVRQCIHRHMREFRKSHLAENMRCKEIDRITRREAKQYMSDKSFIEKNRSIYETDIDGNIVLKQEAKEIVSFDTPRRLTNENSIKNINKNIIRSGYRKENVN